MEEQEVFSLLEGAGGADGVDIRIIQLMLGHASIQQTQSDSMKSSAIDDQTSRSDAAICRPEPRLGVSKGQGKGKVS